MSCSRYFPTESTTSKQRVYPVCTGLLIADVLLQKFSVPGLNGLPLMAALLPITALTGLLLESLRVDVPALIGYFAFIALLAISTALAISPNASLASWALAIVVLFPF